MMFRSVICCSGGLYGCSGGLHAVQGGYMDVQVGAVQGGYIRFFNTSSRHCSLKLEFDLARLVGKLGLQSNSFEKI